MKSINTISLVLIVGLLAGCSRSVSHVDSAGKTESPVFPEQSTAVREEGSFVNIDNLKQMRAGLSKSQVYELIGTPHFKEGIFRVKEWDYIFHFSKINGQVMTCQYKILFDDNLKARSFYYLPESCLSRLNKRPEMERSVKIKKEFSAESFFEFGISRLSSNGIDKVKQFAAELKRENISGRDIIITGYSDRIGTPSTNKQLSLARAESVKNVLVETGIPASDIETQGLADAMPKVFCPGDKSAKVIECLAPNRRMTVAVMN
ncbi:OmpA family protein [Lelliottia aquatilis]|uniref:OmpA family protein n=1 Tax=Lelliottia aquatilis TaxID=2080838 RepID=UPI00192C3D5A|nr:OmpA family protein [Lelliottia aquatilis]MBL5886367.1 outer membrane protein assembly factor BamE [Lelliottia aquatilis]